MDWCLIDLLSAILCLKVSVTVVELDPVMVRCAEEWFGLAQSEGLRVVVGDGVEHMRTTLLQGKEG